MTRHRVISPTSNVCCSYACCCRNTNGCGKILLVYAVQVLDDLVEQERLQGISSAC